MRQFILLVFAFAILACSPRPNDGDANTTTDDQTRPMTDREVNPQGLDNEDMTDGIDPNQSMDADAMGGTDAQVQQTMDAVQGAGGDITALAPSAAVSNIDSWISKLDGMDGTDGIVSNLRTLKDELGASTIDGGKVSGLLSQLASETREVGSGNQGLTMLASALDAGASKLGGK